MHIQLHQTSRVHKLSLLLFNVTDAESCLHSRLLNALSEGLVTQGTIYKWL